MENPIILFQASHGLKPDGDIGPKTLGAIMRALKIPTKDRTAHFMGQSSHESQEFTKIHESFAYRDAISLCKVFRGPFDKDKDRVIDPEEIEFAKKYLGKPIAIGNYVYANRMGNGNEASGDGYKFRGRGPLMMTGKDNYTAFSKFIGEDCVANPDLVATKYYFEAALWYFNVNKLWAICDGGITTPVITKLSKAINLGNANSKVEPNGLADRIGDTLRYWQLLKTAA